MPNQGGLTLELNSFSSGGAAIFLGDAVHLPGLCGSLDVYVDSADRAYLYASNIIIEDGREQPVPFCFGKPLKLTDASGAEMSVSIADIVGRSVLVEYQALNF